MKKTIFILFLVSVFIVSGLTSCSSAPKKVASEPDPAAIEAQRKASAEYDALMAATAQRRADEAKTKAEAEANAKAEEEAKRKALEEANKYDPSKFTVVPSNFKPAEYTSVDLFKAVSDSDKLKRLTSQERELIRKGLGIGKGINFLQCVSDLKFIRQDGLNITFSSDDNAITQIMTIDQRSSLQAGQRIRVYYFVSKTPLITFDVVAIERR